MSQRNPMNERYTSEERTGVTRKSAASAKPKSKAAASVTVKSAKKTPEQRKAAEKAARKEAAAKQREVERKYYKPDTPRYKRLRAIWWVMLIAAIGCTTLSFVGQGALPQWLSVTTLIAAYVFIIGAFVLDFWKIKKERVAYQERMLALEEKNAKAEKQARRVQQVKQAKAKGSGKNQNRHAAPKQGSAEATDDAASAGESDEAPAKPQRRGLFGSGFRLSNREKMQAEKKAAREAKAAAKNGAGESDQQ
ncbi:hypothetical protein [Adlercreutzia caecimuris]|uniref:hypothetical protein n=1 Tax=Adlercreutzia caecimuris TaxID=671266 RepID=UPI00242FCA3F|nr:hypothetical protein [Adlercreutzia caecimuris]